MDKQFKEVKVKDLQVGDKVRLEDDRVERITSITPGFYAGSKLLEYRGRDNWSCVPNGEMVQVEA